MSNYSIISDVGNGIVKILRSQMVPEIILNSDAIGLCSPEDKGDLSLGIYLYDVKESEEMMGRGNPGIAGDIRKAPSQYLNLFYMITAYSSSDIKFRASEEHRILGRVIQTLWDNPILGPDYLSEGNGNMDYPLRIEMLKLDNEEKLKMWNTPNMPYKLSLYYKVYPVEIESLKVKTLRRVVDVDFTVDEKNRN
ncbi:MAG: DUF4255 domain-containing protein [Lacrimispora sp.]|uniref:DUF4255 domain-containing protein n=1 Tax=Lacrimispora sp. TaxID=2719234 RepID=UPI0039E6C71B